MNLHHQELYLKNETLSGFCVEKEHRVVFWSTFIAQSVFFSSKDAPSGFLSHTKILRHVFRQIRQIFFPNQYVPSILFGGKRCTIMFLFSKKMHQHAWCRATSMLAGRLRTLRLPWPLLIVRPRCPGPRVRKLVIVFAPTMAADFPV